MYFLGIDPSATSAGFALLDEAGRIRTIGTCVPQKLGGGARLAFHRDYLLKHVKQYQDQIAHAVIEAPAYDKALKADLLGQIRGIYLLVCADLLIPVTLVAPTAVKKFATGRGTADKVDMIKAAKNHWPDWNCARNKDDEADALWMAEIARGTHNPVGMHRNQLEVLNQLNHLEVADV